jgi:hypothetical protein
MMYWASAPEQCFVSHISPRHSCPTLPQELEQEKKKAVEWNPCAERRCIVFRSFKDWSIFALSSEDNAAMLGEQNNVPLPLLKERLDKLLALPTLHKNACHAKEDWEVERQKLIDRGTYDQFKKIQCGDKLLQPKAAFFWDYQKKLESRCR